ncbi:hypothetical protein [Eubacterium aggregans]|uniref:hypothetical protein n=1 Tax=Eubacterium aggregans TaxID=81409 RepID=UPI003F4185C7
MPGKECLVNGIGATERKKKIRKEIAGLPIALLIKSSMGNSGSKDKASKQNRAGHEMPTVIQRKMDEIKIPHNRRVLVVSCIEGGSIKKED